MWVQFLRHIINSIFTTLRSMYSTMELREVEKKAKIQSENDFYM